MSWFDKLFSMKCIFLFLLFTAAVGAGAQQPGSKSIPPFRMLQSNGTFFTADQLAKGKPTILIYFSPDCDHCQTLMNAYFKRVQEFSKAQVVMVTFKPVQDLTGFINHYNINKFSNIAVGTEGNTFFLRNYYKLADTPFVALYDRSGNLVYAYRKINTVDDLLNRLKAIK